MTPDALRRLVADGECLTVEFKGEEREPLSDKDMIETVVCLANRTGDDPAWLLVGVEDDGRITGARPRHGLAGTDTLRVQALIANRTRPALSCRVEVVRIGPSDILAIRIPASRTPMGTSDGVYLRRAITGRGAPACVPFHFHEMQAAQAVRGSLDYSALVLPDAVWDDLDALEFERMRRYIREARGQGDASLPDLPDIEIAKALGSVEANHEVTGVRVLALLLFGRQEAIKRLLPTHEVAFQVLSGTRIEVNEFFSWPLLRVMDELLSRFRARNQETELMMGLLRIGVPDYSERAFREGIANAVIHRDYTRPAAVHIQWHDDRLEMSSPGGFPEGVHLGNLLVTPPRPRSPLLADAFKRAGIVERTARGIDTIFFEQLRNGRPAPSYERSTETDVVLSLPGGESNLDFVRLIAEEQQAHHTLGLAELLLLNHVWINRRTNTADAAQVIQEPEAETRARLARLVEIGLLEARGERKGRVWHLAARTYDRLGQKAAYVRLRGFEPIQQEQMVAQYAAKHDSISRAEVVELCQITGPQAYRLLKRLVERGVLKQQGARGRAVRYTVNAP